MHRKKTNGDKDHKSAPTWRATQTADDLPGDRQPPADPPPQPLRRAGKTGAMPEAGRDHAKASAAIQIRRR